MIATPRWTVLHNGYPKQTHTAKPLAQSPYLVSATETLRDTGDHNVQGDAISYP